MAFLVIFLVQHGVMLVCNGQQHDSLILPFKQKETQETLLQYCHLCSHYFYSDGFYYNVVFGYSILFIYCYVE